MKRGRALIAGFDVATTCGCADGVSGGAPRAWTWDLRKGGKTRPERLAHLKGLFERYLAENPVDAVFYEAPMPLAAAVSIGTQDETVWLLHGAIGIIEACATWAKVPTLRAVTVHEARRHLLGAGRIPKGEGKALVLERCRVLGWSPANTDEGDAMAIWSYGCGQMSPLVAHMTTPLFAGR